MIWPEDWPLHGINYRECSFLFVCLDYFPKFVNTLKVNQLSIYMDYSEFDRIYNLYGYTPVDYDGIRVYEFRHGRYFGVDILVEKGEESSSAVKKISQAYKKENFSIAIKSTESFENIELDLFKSFFQVEALKRIMNKRYEDFEAKQLNGLPQGAKYQYISGKFLSRYYSSSDNWDLGFSEDEHSDSVLNHIISEVYSNNGPSLVLIEAAAGYGKTCTAYELIHRLCKSNKETLPLYIELSRNREATIFRHILQNEIELQFQNIVTSDVVLYQISKGRIPVVIDGFDELLSKDTALGTKDYHKVEGILNTLFDLLHENAKIIITSRKTAIFSSEDFFSWSTTAKSRFNLLRISLSEPSVGDWLNGEQIKVLEENHFPVENVSNPVLLSYIRNLSLDELKEVSNSNSLVDKYFDLLLNREIQRQNLLMNASLQMRIFLKLARFMCEFNIKSEEKSLIKSLILDYNTSIFNEYIDSFPGYPKPTFDDLAETLSNHVLLDRKSNGTVGFINDFILGTLIGDNIITGKFSEHYTNCKLDSVIEEDFASLAVTAFRVQSSEKKSSLCKCLDDFDCSYSQDYQFQKDVYLRSSLSTTQYSDIAIKDMTVTDKLLGSPSQFKNMVFSSCLFIRCVFRKAAFEQSGLIDCKLTDCKWAIDEQHDGDHTMYMITCTSNNGLEDTLYDDSKPCSAIDEESIGRRVLGCFFRNGHFTQMRRITFIKNALADCDKKELLKEMARLNRQHLIALDGDLCFIQKDGIAFYNKGN